LVDLGKYNVILASKSPRRHELLRGLEIAFEVRTKDVDESFPTDLKGAEIATFLSEKKAAAFLDELDENELLITSDTIVWLGDHVFNKPESEEEAIAMIAELSGRMHEVITAVCLTTKARQKTFYDLTRVTFAEVDRDDIAHYVRKYKPMDKAGAYGIQEWIGYAGIEKIEGSFYNVMGFPTQKFYAELKAFLK
jgi:septum formation protein